MIRAGPLGDRVELCLAAIEKLNETTCHCMDEMWMEPSRTSDFEFVVSRTEQVYCALS
jgi:hypothetical protein